MPASLAGGEYQNHPRRKRYLPNFTGQESFRSFLPERGGHLFFCRPRVVRFRSPPADEGLQEDDQSRKADETHCQKSKEPRTPFLQGSQTQTSGAIHRDQPYG